MQNTPSRLLPFYFTADGHGFRELVKDLAAIFRIRIEVSPTVRAKEDDRWLGSCGRLLVPPSWVILRLYPLRWPRSKTYPQSFQDFRDLRSADVPFVV